jgi:molybdopterin-guanine dinucleotide biosynthesis protein A
MNEELYPDLGVAVLAGGASSRFGTDKALFRLNGHGPTLLERSVASGGMLSDVIAVIGRPKYQELIPGIPIVEDEVQGRGPLGAIVTALRALGRPRVLVLGCDMPCLSVPLLRWLAILPTEADVLVPQTADGRLQTMHAIYRQSAIPAIDRALASGAGAVVSFFPDVGVRTVGESEMRRLDPQLDSLLSVNRPDDIERARRCASCK